MFTGELKAETLNLAMSYEIDGYSKSVMDFFMTLLRNLDGETRTETLFFLQFTNECTFKLYCEVMRQLPSIENEPVGGLSYDID